jgi:hypothetical protein
MPQQPTQHAVDAGSVARSRGARGERLLVGLALLTLMGLGEASAGEAMRLPAGSETFIDRDPPASADARAQAAQPAAVDGAHSRASARSEREAPRGTYFSSFSPLSSPSSPAWPTGSMSAGLPGNSAFGAKDDPFGLQDFTLKELAPREFRGRPRALGDADAAVKADDSLMEDRDTWQRLASEYRVQRRVRVVTLWDAGWSSVSLQAGKHGDPSLQWTGHLFGRSEAHRGVLDRWMPSTPGAGDSGGARGVVHALTPFSPRPSASSSIASRLSNGVP